MYGWAAFKANADKAAKASKYVLPATFIGRSPDKHGAKKYDTAGGKRLAAMLAGGNLLAWRDLFPKTEPYPWDKRAASRAAWRMARARLDDSEPWVLLGGKVCEAFAVPNDWLGWYRSPEHRHPMIAFPHPSPLNRFWNEPRLVQQAQELLLDLAAGRLPYVEKESVRKE